MLRLEGVQAGYGAIRVLHQVSLLVKPRQVVCLLGANGAGKTTTLNCISGFVRPTSGHIWLDSEEITRLPTEEIVRRGIVQVPEGRAIFPELSVYDNLVIGTWPRRRQPNALAPLDEVFNYFPRLKERRSQLAGTLSGGEQQMLMIGRALMSKPRIIMLDEPSLGLSPLLVQSLFAIIRRMHQSGMTFLLVEQNARVALRASEYGYILDNGEMGLHGQSVELAGAPEVVAAYLGG